jgi:hypothetical protein
MTYPSSTARPPASKARRQMREALAILVILLIAGGAIGGGYFIANHGGTPLQSLFAFGQPTPIPTLQPLDALNQIGVLYPAATVSVSTPLSDEVDLITQNQAQSDSTLTSRQTTQIMEIFMRGYGDQPFWRWTDSYAMSGNKIVYEAHASELWVITLRPHGCSAVWTIYAITPQQIISRGVRGGDYLSGTASHLGTGTLPDGLSAC